MSIYRLTEIADAGKANAKGLPDFVAFKYNNQADTCGRVLVVGEANGWRQVEFSADDMSF